MATISLMVVCCEIFSIEGNWGKRRGEGTPSYGWGRVRCGFLMCRTAGRGVVGRPRSTGSFNVGGQL